MITGLYTALITPFLEDGSIDEVGLRQNIQFQIKAGVDGLLVLGTTGESPTLSHDEKCQIIQITKEECHGKIPLMVGTGSYSTKATIEMTSEARKLGADSVLVVTPFYNKPTEDGVRMHFEAIAKSTDLPICIYDIPGRTSAKISLETMQKLSQIENIVCVKSAVGDITQMSEIIETICRKSRFTILSGDDGLTYPMMALGGHGLISVASNLIPGWIRQLVHGENAKELHFKFASLIRALFIETNPIPIKTAMQLCGMPSGPFRLPLCEMKEDNRKHLMKVLKEYESELQSELRETSQNLSV